MLIVCTIAICLFTFICIFSCNSHSARTIEHLEHSISRALNEEGIKDKAPPPVADGSNPLDMPNIFALCVFINGDGKPLRTNQSADIFDQALIKIIVQQALSSGDEHGRVNDGELMFLKRSSGKNTVIAFTSTKIMDDSIRATVLLSISICLATIIVFFAISERLAHYAVKPVKNAWDSQKQFVEDASHDLKTPLTVILANNDILLSHKNESIRNQQKWVDSTTEEALKMKSLVTQMLDLAKSENSHSLTLDTVNLSEITEGEILQIEPIAFEKKITICPSIKNDVLLSTNKEAYRRIVCTLLDNAIKYSRELEKIRISLVEDKRRAYLYVNSPTHIDENVLVHIFERFYRGDPARSDGGYGLGLAIAKNLAISLHGDLKVKSEPVVGTTFILSIKKK